MDTILQIPIRIIKEQELVIGPIAWDEAKKVSGLVVDQAHDTVSFSGDAKDVINRLVSQYEKIFGRASHVVCHDAVKDIVAKMPPNEIPDSLK
jgi:hypothetical protein